MGSKASIRSRLPGQGLSAGALPGSVADVEREVTIRNLIALRLGIGVAAWFMPRVAGRLFGLDVAANPQLPYLGRLFGVRDAALAIGTLTSDGDAQIQWLRAGMGCDVADALAGLAGWRAGYLPTPAAALVTATAVAAAAQGAVALRDS